MQSSNLRSIVTLAISLWMISVGSLAEARGQWTPFWSGCSGPGCIAPEGIVTGWTRPGTLSPRPVVMPPVVLPGAVIPTGIGPFKPPPTVDEQHAASLLLAVQRRLELDPRLDGALVLEIRLIKGDAASKLQVIGRVISADQSPFLSDIVQESMDLDSWWEDQTGVTIELKEMALGTISNVLAGRYFGIALDSFWANDYVTADLAIMRAIADAPDMDTYRYWRVLTALAMNQLDRAELLLRPLIRRHPFGSREAAIARELERVQGPLRWTLLDMEKRVVLTQLP